MSIPTLPSTHTWVQGGPILDRAGNYAMYTSDTNQVWVWNEDTGAQVTNLLDANANPITTVPVVGGRIDGVGVPVAVQLASFSVGQFGPRYYALPVQTIRQAIAGGGANDSAVAGFVNTGGSNTDVALKGRYVPQWKPNTFYSAGYAVVNPSGDIVTAKVNFTSGTSYSAANWNLSPTYESGTSTILYVDPVNGNDAAFGRTWSGAKKTIAAAVTTLNGTAGMIILSEGQHLVGNGLPLSGARCSIVGQGAGAAGGDMRTEIYANTQSGPVIDFTGYLWPNNFQGQIQFGGFAIVGSAVADATKNNAGIRIAKAQTPAAGSAYWHDIAIRDTGGPCMDLGFVYLCNFERIVLNTPVSAKANDVPYLLLEGGNSNRFRGIGLRSVLSSGDVGVSGAIVIRPKSGINLVPYMNLFDSTWFEFLHVPDQGCLVSCAANYATFNDTQFNDLFKESGATNTAHFRFVPPVITPSGDYGGNIVSGYIPGRGTGVNPIDFGVDMQQSGNLVEGIKGYNGYNVNIASGVRVTVNLWTAESSSGNPAVVNGSTQSGVIIRDDYLRTFTSGPDYQQDVQNSIGGGRSGPRWVVPGAPATGGLWIGNAGVSFETPVSGQSRIYADKQYMLSLNGANYLTADLAANPGLIFPDAGSLPATTYQMQGKMVTVRGAAGVADQFWVCVSNALGAYVWQQITTAKSGTAVLVAGTVTVADAKITANSVIRLSSKTLGGTPGALFVSAKTAGTSFVITSTNAADTSTVYYEVITY